MLNYITGERYYLMEQNNLIRLAFVFSNNRKVNFLDNLKLLILSILDENETYSTVDEILNCIKNKYGLEYSKKRRILCKYI